MTKLLSGKWAIVTGANRGIGRAIVELFAAEGANVVACARTENAEFAGQLGAIAAREGAAIEPLYFDLADTEKVKEAARTLVSSQKPIDILVNNAGTPSGSLFQMTPLQELRRVFEVNFFSQIVFTQSLSRAMARRRTGSIINIASVAGLHGDPGMLAYGSSKAALMLATKVMAAELGNANVRVNAIAPNVTKTDMYDQMEAKAREKLIQSSALKRAAEPLEVARAALFLASDLSTYVNGQVLTVDGGRA